MKRRHLRTDREPVAHEPVAAPFGPVRSCIHLESGGAVTLAPRRELAADPAGDPGPGQAGPKLLADGRAVVGDGDPEGFSAAAGQFDSDITAEPVVTALLFDPLRGPRPNAAGS